MGVDLGGIQILMAKNFLDSFDIHTAGKHHGGSGVPQLMGGKLGGVQSGLQKRLFDQTMNRADTDSVVIPGSKEGAIVR